MCRESHVGSVAHTGATLPPSSMLESSGTSIVLAAASSEQPAFLFGFHDGVCAPQTVTGQLTKL
eukprot:5882275-Pyramimonas_sp.AAC.3